MDLPSALSQLRADRGLTQRELAEVIGVSHGYIAMVERGQRTPGSDLVTAWAVACGYDLSFTKIGSSEEGRFCGALAKLDPARRSLVERLLKSAPDVPLEALEQAVSMVDLVRRLGR